MKNANESWSFAQVFFLRSFSSSSSPLPFSPLLSFVPPSSFPSSHGAGRAGGNLRGEVKVSREKRKLSLMAVFLGRNT